MKNVNRGEKPIPNQRCYSADLKVSLAQTSAFGIRVLQWLWERKRLHWKRQEHQADSSVDGRPSVLTSWLERKRERERRAVRVVGWRNAAE